MKNGLFLARLVLIVFTALFAIQANAHSSGPSDIGYHIKRIYKAPLSIYSPIYAWGGVYSAMGFIQVS